jgi:aconitate hydratase
VLPDRFNIDDSLFIQPTFSREVFRGPNMEQSPQNTPMPQDLKVIVAIKLDNKITTDHILPTGSVSSYRSNIQNRYHDFNIRGPAGLRHTPGRR